MKPETKTLNQLQPGDPVIIEHRGRKTEAVVERVIKSHIVVNGDKYRKSSGRALSDDTWSARYLEVATPENVAAVKKQMDANRVRKALMYISDQCRDDDVAAGVQSEVLAVYRKLRERER